MGKIMQRGMVRKRSLEIALSMVEPHPRPKPHLEQYTIPPEVAAEILFIATYVFKDIEGKRVIDLGCGTGRLSIGAVLLGAKEVVGIDIDEVAIKIAVENAKRLGVEDRISWVIGDIEALHGSFDTVLQNPPFGVQRRKADRKFLAKAIKLGRCVYSLHKAGNEEFIRRFVEKQGGKVTVIIPHEIWVPYTFPFHKKRKHLVKVELYRIEGKHNV